MAPVGFTRGRICREGGAGQGIVRATHSPLGRGFPVLLDCHSCLRLSSRPRKCEASRPWSVHAWSVRGSRAAGSQALVASACFCRSSLALPPETREHSKGVNSIDWPLRCALPSRDCSANTRLVHRDLGQCKQQLVFHQIRKANGLAAHRQRIVGLRKQALLVAAGNQRQRCGGDDSVIETLQAALTTKLQPSRRLAVQYRAPSFVALECKPKGNIACRIEQKPPQTRHVRQRQATGIDEAVVYGSPRIQEIWKRRSHNFSMLRGGG
jgi:hypothetical protein